MGVTCLVFIYSIKHKVNSYTSIKHKVNSYTNIKHKVKQLY